MDVASIIVLILIVLIILAVLALAIVIYDAIVRAGETINDGINEIVDLLSQRYQQYVNGVCQQSSIEFKGSFTPFTSKSYNEANSQYLIFVAIDTTRANCDNLILPPPPGFDKAYEIIGINPFGGQSTMFAYYFVSTSMNVHLVSFTGTWSFQEWEDDLDYPQIPPTLLNNYSSGQLVHGGWYKVYISVRDAILGYYKQLANSTTQLVITGHSLGGALSTLCAFDMSQINTNNLFHYSYAAPPVGNPNWSNTFDELVYNSWRILNSSDIVPELPPPIITGYLFQQTSDAFVFNDNMGNYLSNHVKAYLDVIGGDD